MLYTVCNKLGETQDRQISDSDQRFSQANVTAFRDKNQNPIFSVTFDSQVFFAVATGGDVPAATAESDSDTPDEIHIPVEEEPSSD